MAKIATLLKSNFLFTDIEFSETSGNLFEFPDASGNIDKLNALAAKGYYRWMQVTTKDANLSKAYCIFRNFLKVYSPVKNQEHTMTAEQVKAAEVEILKQDIKQTMAERFVQEIPYLSDNAEEFKGKESNDFFIEVKDQYKLIDFYPQLLIKCFYVRLNWEKEWEKDNNKIADFDINEISKKFSFDVKDYNLESIDLADEKSLLFEVTGKSVICYMPKLAADSEINNSAILKNFTQLSHIGFNNKAIHFLLNGNMDVKKYAELWRYHEAIKAIESYEYKKQE